MDLHKNYLQTAVMNEEGRVLRNYKYDNKQISRFFDDVNNDKAHVVMETADLSCCLLGSIQLYFFPAPRCSTRYAKIKHTLVIHIQFSHIVCTGSRRTLSLGWPEPYRSKFSFKVPAVAPITSRSNADPFYARQVAASKYTDSRTSSSYTDDTSDSLSQIPIGIENPPVIT
jgi:hypothetical protein